MKHFLLFVPLMLVYGCAKNENEFSGWQYIGCHNVYESCTFEDGSPDLNHNYTLCLDKIDEETIRFRNLGDLDLEFSVTSTLGDDIRSTAQDYGVCLSGLPTGIVWMVLTVNFNKDGSGFNIDYDVEHRPDLFADPDTYCDLKNHGCVITAI